VAPGSPHTLIPLCCLPCPPSPPQYVSSYGHPSFTAAGPRPLPSSHRPPRSPAGARSGPLVIGPARPASVGLLSFAIVVTVSGSGALGCRRRGLWVNIHGILCLCRCRLRAVGSGSPAQGRCSLSLVASDPGCPLSALPPVTPLM
jgi:hypothetical protein